MLGLSDKTNDVNHQSTGELAWYILFLSVCLSDRPFVFQSVMSGCRGAVTVGLELGSDYKGDEFE